MKTQHLGVVRLLTLNQVTLRRPAQVWIRAHSPLARQVLALVQDSLLYIMRDYASSMFHPPRKQNP